MDASHYLPFSRVAAAPGSPVGAPMLGGQAPGSSLPELASCPSLPAWPAGSLRRAGGLGQLCRFFLLPAVPSVQDEGTTPQPLSTGPAPMLLLATQPDSPLPLPQACSCPSGLPRLPQASPPLPPLTSGRNSVVNK